MLQLRHRFINNLRIVTLPTIKYDTKTVIKCCFIKSRNKDDKRYSVGVKTCHQNKIQNKCERFIRIQQSKKCVNPEKEKANSN